MQAPQCRAGLDPELIDEHATPCGEHLERLGLASGAVQGEHQLAAQALAQGMRRNELLELRDDLAVPAEREPRVHVILGGGDALLLEAADRLLRERLVADVRQCRSAPQPERLGEVVGRLLGPARGELGASAGDQLLETRHVELAGRHPRDIAGPFRDDHARRRTIGLDHLAQL